MPNTQKQYDLCISYTQEDAAWVEGYLLDALKEAGARIYTEEAFALGVPRLVEFERAIRESQHTLLVLSPAYLAQNFAQFTDLLAQSFGLETDTWPVIPLILKDVELPTRLGIGTALDATTPKKQERAIERLCLELRRPVPGPALIPDCPYPGMVPFLEADSPRFFGRVREIQACLEKLRLHPFLTVIGPSGSGKSSLVFAGLIPALKKSRLFGKGDWQVRIMRPGESPHTTLRAALDSFRGDERALLIIDQFEEIFTLTPDEKLAPESTTEVPRFLNALLHLTDKSNIYITLTVRADFYGELMNAAIWKQVQEHRLEIAPLNPENLRQAIIRPAENARVFIEAALVERLLTEATGEPGMLPFVQETLVLLWEHIQRRFLSLHAYEELVAFHSGQIGGQPRTGLQAAMTRRADATLAQLSSQEQSIARRVFLRLVQFGEGRADTRRQQPVAALRTAGDAPELFEQTIQHLTTNRLLTLSGEEGESSHQVDIAHEALIAGWPTLQAWLTERREAEQTRRRLEAKAAEWVRLGRGESGLLDELELMEAKYWFNSPDAFELGYSKSLSTLVKASRAAIRTAEREHEATREHELEQTRKLARTQQQRAAILLIGLVIAIALSLIVFSLNRKANASLTRAEIANTQSAASAGTAQAASTLAVLERNLAETAQANAGQERSKAEAASTLAVAQEATANAASTHAIAERNIAATALAQLDETGALSRIVLSRQLADKALSVLDQQLDLALLLGVEAYKSFDTLDAKLALLTALQRGLNRDIIPFETAIPRQTAPLYSVALSPDGERMAWGDEDGVITVWNYPQGIVERTFRASAGVIIWGLAFSPDG
ncbi:MAG: TIR domain-containing protein, partial [Anaerolineales bacterium]